MPTAGRVAQRPRQRGRPKVRTDDEQRKLIAACARELFVKNGYGRTTTDDVAASCKISKQTLYRLFPGKPALFTTIVDLHRLSMLALPGDYDGLPLDRAIENIFKIDIDAAADEERVAVLRMVMLEAHQYPELGEILRRHGADRSRAELAKWLAQQARNGLIVIDDADSVAGLLLDMIFGAIALKTISGLSWPDSEDRKAHIRRCVAVFLNGVRPR
jgi:AcrR family transcriptional regulator